MRKFLANIRRLLGLAGELEGLKKELDITNGQLEILTFKYIDAIEALKLLTAEQGASYKELRSDLNTSIELYTALEARVNTTENLLPETLGQRLLEPVSSYRSFRARRHELELKNSRKLVNESKPAEVAEGT